MKRKSKQYTIHFVCKGNTYRSRLAAAYFATISGARFTISSSGVGVKEADIHTIQPYTKAIAKRNGLTYGLKDRSTQTTNALLKSAHVIVFMHKDVYESARKDYTFDERKTVVWNVADFSPEERDALLAKGGEQAMVDATSDTLNIIQGNCDTLYEYLTHTEWVDIIDKDNHQTGLRLPLAWANDRALWHRGVHVLVQTHDGKFVVGKRANDIVFAPGMLEITLGGGVDAGETVLQAAQRETYEEIGVLLPQSSFKPLFVDKSNHYHPHYKKHNPTYVYFYAATLPLHSERLRPQPGEVSELRLLSKRQVKHLLNTTRIENFGRLSYGRKQYKKAVDYTLTTV